METPTQCPKCNSTDIITTHDKTGYSPDVNFNCGQCGYYFGGRALGTEDFPLGKACGINGEPCESCQ